MEGYQFQWSVISSNLPFLLKGGVVTLEISALTLVFSTMIGLAVAAMSMGRSRISNAIALIYGEAIRNTPILVQLLWVYYVLPITLNIQIDAFSACVLGLSLYSGAFNAEVFRSGIQAVPKGHREAAEVLGLSTVQSFFRIILPQATRIVLPALAANFVQLIKYSSLGAVISVSEITRRGMELSSATFRPLEIFTFLGVMYFFICWPLAMAVRLWERQLAHR
jgi:polar amino acid transport system permease protein